LFSLRTMGFRGEALPSIAAIAQLEVKSRRKEDELGTMLCISGSKIEKQELISYVEGTSIAVKNIFYNVPARRKFLKSNETERRNIFNEIEQIALVHPGIEFILIENDIETLNLPKTNLRQRIVQLEGKKINDQLLEIEEETSLGKIYGYVSRPEFAKKSRASQYFFVNNRYIRHPYFNSAVMSAYSHLIDAREKPSYFIFFEVDPKTIDVNIHPTKTEVKFENEQALWQILMVIVKESLGRFNAVPTIDFDREDAPEIPIYDSNKDVSMPSVSLSPDYNPFSTHNSHSLGMNSRKAPSFDWEKLYENFERAKDKDVNQEGVLPENLFSNLDGKEDSGGHDMSVEHYQYKQKYIITSVKSGLMVIDQHRAHVRILFDKYLSQIKDKKGTSQRVVFPEIIELSASDSVVLPTIEDDLEALGFEISDLGNYSYAIQGVPVDIEGLDVVEVIHSMISSCRENGSDVKSEIQESIANSYAKITAIPYGKILSREEMLSLVSQLFSLQSPSYTPDGKKVMSILYDSDIDKMLK
ncbi:MAG: DNA mismatch repair endonuclease MutL, partial [Fermentimonas sp.]